MKKKLLAFLLSACTAVGCTFGLSACSQTNDNQTKWGNEYSYATAYAQAQELGYAGTLDEFINMISGKDGTDGKNGNDGADGKDGLTPFIGENGNWFIGETDTGVKAAGTNGTNGIDGKDGADGANGIDGKDGADGANGIDGKDGADGANGIDGKDGVSVKDAFIDHDGHLIIVFTNYEKIDCGIVLNSHNHEYGEWITISEASCKNFGFEIRVCETCEIAETKIIPKTEDHVWSNWQADEETDTHFRECSVCKKTETAPHNGNEDDVCADCGKYIGEALTISLILPVEGEITTKFGFGKDATLGHWHFHTGIDIAAEKGTEVVAAMDGTVESIIRGDTLDGSSITIVYASGIKTIYQFVDADANLKVGDKVKQGDVIGTVSVANGSEYLLGAHIHFELYLNNEPVDPELYID